MWTVKTLAVLLLYILLLCHGQAAVVEVCDEELEAKFISKRFSPAQYGISMDIICTVIIHASSKNKIQLEISFSASGRPCQDKIMVYDGRSYHEAVLEEMCDSGYTKVVSSGSDVLLIYTSPSGRSSYGFTVDYSTVMPDDDDRYEGFTSSPAIVAVLVPIILFGVIGFIIWRSCKAQRKLKDDLAAHGYSVHDLRLTRITVAYKSRSGELSTEYTGFRGRPRTRGYTRREIGTAMERWYQNGMTPDPNEPLQVIVQEHMDLFSSQRQRNQPTTCGRVRHPAGDIQPDQSPFTEQYPLNPRHPPSDPPFLLVGAPDTEIHGSNNNLAINNNSTPNLNYVNGHNGSYPYAPSDHSPHSSLGRRSPHFQNQGADNVLTYYGMVSDDGPMPSAPPDNKEEGCEDPPPSYDEVTAGGKLSPYNNQL